MIFDLKQTDTLPRLRASLITSAGVPVKLTGATVALILKNTVSNAVVSRAATVIDALGGVVEYAWQASDTSALAVYDAEWRVTWVDGVQTVPGAGVFQVRIRARL